jgi:predicted dehydrogenase
MSLKLIQVGLGAHGRGVGHDFVIPSPDFEYAGLVDLDLSVLKGFAKEFHLSDHMTYTDYKQAFRECDADAVLISAISPVHYEIAKEALERNLHVLIEKPFVLNMEDAEELVQLAAEKKKSLMISQNYRYLSTVLTLKHAIRDSGLGKLLFVKAEFFCQHDGKGYQREMEDYMLLEMSVHHVDMIRFLSQSNIASVRGHTWNYPESGYRGDPNVNAVYKTESGIPVFYTGSLLAPGMWTPWEGVWRFQFEKGAVYLDDLGDGYGVYSVDGQYAKTKIPTVKPEKESIHGVLSEFASSIREDREPSVSGRHNLNTLAALIATGLSSREDREIRL